MPDPTQPVPGPTREQTITYTNWRGETAQRRIVPERLWYGVTEWHPEPGWLLDATDLDKRERRVFALSGFDTDTTLALLPARPSRCGFMSLGRQCQLPPVHDGEDHKLDLTEPARPSPTDDDRVAELLAGADEWHASLPRLYPDHPDGLVGEYPINPGLVQNLVGALRDARAEGERLRAHQGTT